MLLKHYATGIRLTLILATLGACQLGYGQIYKTVDEKGNPVFSDQATDGEVVDIKSTNTVPAATPSASPTTNATNNNDDNHYSKLSVVSPANDSIIANGLTPFQVSVSSSPALQSGHKFVLSIDGTVYSRGTSNQFTVDKVGRGAHTIQVSIADQSGRTIMSSSSNSFFAYWPGGR